LEEINIPEGVIDIGSSAFLRCRSLTHIELPSTLRVLGSAFAHCTSLAGEMIIPDLVQRIKSNQPAMTDSEIKVCILSMMPFSVKEVADILDVSSAMIGKARTSIRKKLGMTEARGNIEEYVLGMTEK
jgi:DNA-binding CsgD family transcriptional regulator